MKAERRRCPIAGCAHTIEAGFLMCRPHWRRVSDATRRAVNGSWREFNKASKRLRVRDQKADNDTLLTAFGAACVAYEQARTRALAEAARDPGAELAGRMSTDVVVDDFHTAASTTGRRHD